MNVDLLLSLSNISKTYRKQGREIKALCDVSISVTMGETLGILGPNGSGKSSLVKIISGLCLPERGHIDWHTHDNRRRSIGVLLEGRLNLMERLSTLENAKYYCALRQCGFSLLMFRQLAQELALVDVHSPVRKLSTGNKLRSALLLAFIHRPSLVMLDEPTTGMDFPGVQRLTHLIKRISEQGCGFVICSHDLEFIDDICHHIVCLNQGGMVFNGDKRDFLKKMTLRDKYEALTKGGAHAAVPPHRE